ncbi:hypothetical protein MPER_07887, partial [Moniliophthora perniciosa FA553]
MSRPSTSHTTSSRTIPGDENSVGHSPGETMTPEKPSQFLVDKLDDNDPNNPKACISFFAHEEDIHLSLTGMDSAPGGISQALIERFDMSKEVATLTISLFVAGPLIWGPLSEQFGRRPIFILSFFVYMMFQIGTALAQNKATIIGLRFLGGTFAACPLTNS